jgi:hypothetical protein
MDEGTRNTTEVQPIGLGDARDPLQEQLRGWIRSAIETLLREELDAVLQATRYARDVDGTRHGYRHASRDRQLSTSVGPTPVTVPRARYSTTEAPPASNGNRPCCRGCGGSFAMSRELVTGPACAPRYNCRTLQERYARPAALTQKLQERPSVMAPPEEREAKLRPPRLPRSGSRGRKPFRYTAVVSNGSAA